MKRFSLFIAALAIVMFSVPVFSQINLNYLYSRGVNSRKSTCTKIDSVLVETKTFNGVATTILTVTMTPDLYSQCSYYSIITDSVVTWQTTKIADTMKTNDDAADEAAVRTVKYTYGSEYKCKEPGEIVDSIEITSSFSLPTDFVAKNLYLWVNGQRQTGFIQDRALASQQYNQIVGVRRDPALLEFWGNGRYNLRIFPAKSLVSRKVSIEFQHTFDDNSPDMITAFLPFQYDSANLSYSYGRQKKYPIGFIRVCAGAQDERNYVLDVPGLGAGSFSKNAGFMIEKSNVGKLGSGSIQSKDPSGQYEFLWSAPDTNNRTTLGFSTILSKSNVSLEPEPDTRIIVLDIQKEMWNYNDYYEKYYQYAYPWISFSKSSYYTDVNLLLRAKKNAVLCLQSYVAQNQKFNVVLTRPGSQKPAAVFENPVAPTEENLLIAYNAILEAQLSASTSIEALTEAIEQTPKGIIIFITDLYQPYDYGRYEDRTYSKYTISETGGKYDALIDSISRLVIAAGPWFFTICDDGKLNQIASSAGGYNLASLRWESYYRRIWTSSTDGGRQVNIQLPPLFGNYYGLPITGLNVTAPDVVGECVFTVDGYNYYYSRMAGGEAIMLSKQKAMAKSAIVAPYPYYSDSALFRLAAKLTSYPYYGTLDFTVSGKMGGLRFTKTITADASPLRETFEGPEHYGLWAFRKTEQLATADWAKSADSIRWIGLAHHIVTRQTSLLALEPGMELWKDTINPSSSDDAVAGGTAEPSNQKLAFNASGSDSLSYNMNLDGMSLQDLIAKKSPVLEKNVSTKPADMTLGFSKAGIKISVPQSLAGNELSVSLYTLQGRLIASKRCATVKATAAAGAYLVNFGATLTGTGFYLVKAKIGSYEKVVSVPSF